MSLDDPVIAVIGAGAVGGYYGARMIQHGCRVHLLTQSDCAAIREHGMKIVSRDGDFTLDSSQVSVYDDPRQMPRADLILVTLKTTANHRLSEFVRPLLKDDSIILTLQNGLGNEELLAELFGTGRILGGMAFVCINRIGPGEISHTDHGLIRIGEPAGGRSSRTAAIAKLFNACKIPCQVLDNLVFGRWDKLVWNIPFNGLGAALDMTTDQIISSPAGLSLVRTLCTEVLSACRSLNLPFDLNVIEEKICHTQTMGPYKTSMQIDRQLRRPMEVEAIIGRPVAFAQKYNIATPFLTMLYEMLLLLDGRRKSNGN